MRSLLRINAVKWHLLLLIALLTSCDKGENEIFILPADYVGYVLIIYNQPTGEKIKHVDGTRIYNVPANGILKVQDAPNDGWKAVPEFYYEKIDSQRRVYYIIPPYNVPADSVFAYGGAFGRAYKNPDGKRYVEFSEYTVGNNAQSDSAYSILQRIDISLLGE